MKNNRPKVLFILPYPLGKAPSQRFRVEQFLPFLDEEQISYRLAPFMTNDTWQVLYKGNKPLQKIWGIFKGYLKRIRTLIIDVPKADIVFVHREGAPLGPPFFEWLIAKLYRKKIILDFDDAIWIAPTTQNILLKTLRAYWKTRSLCKWSYKIVGGNDYLCNYAKKYNAHVIKIPTCVDTINVHNTLKDQGTDKVVIGWTGSHSTMPYLDLFMPVYRRLYKQYDIEFVIISNQEPIYNDPGIRFIKWQEATEVQDLLNINIGIMPLTNDPWSEGKCGFKLIQYMALGIPAVASPVGVNQIIIEPNNGFLCQSEEEWYSAIVQLIKSSSLRTRIGASGRKKIQEEYCIHTNRTKFISLFTK